MSAGAPDTALAFAPARQRAPRGTVLLGTIAACFVATFTACSEATPANTAEPASASPIARIQTQPVAPRAPSNVLLIVIDSLRKDRMSAYGYERNTTPRIAELASDGVLYTGAVSQAPWTTPSIGSLMTSRYPSSLGIETERSVIPESLDMLAERLQDAGFATGGVVSHTFCSTDWGFAQGFDSFDESNILGHDAVTSAGVSDRGIEFLEANAEAERGDRPWLLFLHYFDPHFAYNAHDAFPFGGPHPDYAGRLRSGMLFKELNAQRDELSPDDMTELARYYDSELAHTDAEIGRVLDHLRTTGEYASTLVVVAADHGEEFLDHGRLGHAKTLYDELVNVPLIVRYPGGAPAVIDDPVGLIDVYPTITEFVGTAAPDRARGTSLYDVARGRHRTPADVFTETSRYANLRALIEGDHKLVLDVSTGGVVLFDRRTDPHERIDIARREPQRAKRLAKRVRAVMEMALEDVVQTTDRTLSPEEEERLRQLGYL